MKRILYVLLIPFIVVCSCAKTEDSVATIIFNILPETGEVAGVNAGDLTLATGDRISAVIKAFDNEGGKHKGYYEHNFDMTYDGEAWELRIQDDAVSYAVDAIRLPIPSDNCTAAIVLEFMKNKYSKVEHHFYCFHVSSFSLNAGKNIVDVKFIPVVSETGF